ncbi:9563_t:CDS:2, partial [Racocetra persica]
DKYPNTSRILDVKYYLAMHGNFVKKNDNKATDIFKQVVQILQSDSKYKDVAKYILAKFYESGQDGAKKDYKKVYDIYLELSKSKSDFQDDVKYCLAEYYLNSYGTKKDLVKAFDIYSSLLLRKSHYQNNAKFWLAHCYDNGNGVTKNKDKALQLYLELLKSKEYRLKVCESLDGNSVTKNKDKALQLYLELLKSKEYRLNVCESLANYYKDKDDENAIVGKLDFSNSFDQIKQNVYRTFLCIQYRACTINSPASKRGDSGKDIVIEVNGFTFVFQYKAYFKRSIDRINVNKVESTVRVGNLDVEGIRKGEFDAGFLIVLKCTCVKKIAFQIAGLSKEKIIITTYDKMCDVVKETINDLMMERINTLEEDSFSELEEKSNYIAYEAKFMIVYYLLFKHPKEQDNKFILKIISDVQQYIEKF